MKPNTRTNQKTGNVIATKLILIAVGLLLLVLPIISLLVDTQLIFIKHMTRIAKGSDIVHSMLQQEIPGAFVHVYVFNVNNGEAFTSGEDDKLKLQEVGPFIYQEFRRNEQFELDEKAGVMRYTPRVWLKFVPEGSIGDPHKINVTVPNTALLAMASMLSEQRPFLKSTFNILVTGVKASVLMNMDVHSLLWGYEEPLITVSSGFLPHWITFRKVGMLDRLYDRAAVPRLELGITGLDKFRIITINGARGLTTWEYDNPSKRTRCNTLEDTYEGIAYPPELTSKTKLRIYRNIFCRILDLDLVGNRTMDYGAEAFVYKINNNSFNIGPSTECLCGKWRCKNGVSDLSPCLYNLSIALSHAHFLHGDPHIYERIEGIYPDEEKHGSEIVVDRKVGLVLKTRFTLQINVDVADVGYNQLAKPFSNMIVPVFYFTIIQADMPEEAKETIYWLYFHFFYTIRGTAICTLILGLVVLLFAVRKIFWNVVCSKRLRYQIYEKMKPLNIVQTEVPLMDEKGFDQKEVIESEN